MLLTSFHICVVSSRQNTPHDYNLIRLVVGQAVRITPPKPAKKGNSSKKFPTFLILCGVQVLTSPTTTTSSRRSEVVKKDTNPVIALLMVPSYVAVDKFEEEDPTTASDSRGLMPVIIHVLLCNLWARAVY